MKGRLRREDFVLADGWFEEAVRGPGSLHGQQFQVADCEECEVWLFDAAACVYVDNCLRCLVFVGACEGAVFVRNCRQVTVVANTRQMRLRDSQLCRCLLTCQTQPVIEASSAISFGPFPSLSYAEMLPQMEAVRLTPFLNFWHDVYDFTPPAQARLPGSPASDPHFRLVLAGDSAVFERCFDKLIEAGLKPERNRVPRCLGKFSLTAHAEIVVYRLAQASLAALPPASREFYDSRVCPVDKALLKKWLSPPSEVTP